MTSTQAAANASHLPEGEKGEGAHKPLILLEDYKAPDFAIDTVQLTVKLHDKRPSLIDAAMQVRRQSGVQNLVLDGGPYMRLLGLTLNGETLEAGDFKQTSTQLIIYSVPDTFCLNITVEVEPDNNTRLEGLYRSGGTFCTQCEAEGFRHIMYFLDRPDVLARYQVRIEADKALCPVLLSNGNKLDEGELSGGRHYAVWDDPFPKPAYLFALVAGNLGVLSDSFTTMSGRSVALHIYVPHADVPDCTFAMGALKRSMAWDEEVFGLEYDLDIYNIVAVPDFNMGAMENKSLNVFNTKYVLASPDTATDDDYDHIEGVIGHEYFHNWTGNRVTCRDWFQLSLKEGLTVFRDQLFSADMTSPAIKRLDDVRVLRQMQFQEDAGPLAHPVRPEAYVEINNFYTATVYNKGAEVVRMIATILGFDAFKKGLHLYLTRHDGQAATVEDFVRAMEEASGQSLAQFFRWYQRPGTPSVQLVRSAAADGSLCLTLKQTQSDVATSQAAKEGRVPMGALHIPIRLAVLGRDGALRDVRISEVDAAQVGAPEALGTSVQPLAGEPSQSSVRPSGVPGEYIVHLRDEVVTLKLEGATLSDVPSVLRGFSAPIRLDSDLTLSDHMHLAKHDTDAFVRADAAEHVAKTLIHQNYTASLCAVQSQGESAAAGSAPQQSAQLAAWTAFFGHVLMEANGGAASQDDALSATLLKLPDELTLSQNITDLDPTRMYDSRTHLYHQVQTHFAPEMLAVYERTTRAADADMPTSRSARRLKNVMLSYLSGMPEYADLAVQQYSTASGMTDRLAALQALVNSAHPKAADCLGDFYERFRTNALVVDKWFSVQAASKAEGALGAIEQLVKHSAFQISNPNRLRALVGVFAVRNISVFHDLSGRGYDLLADIILSVDKLNPQMAARFVAPLGNWKQFEVQRSNFMKNKLRHISEQTSLSDDTRELVDKALNA